MLANAKERLLYFLEKSGISKSQFYSDCDLKRGLLDSDKMRGSISDSVIAKILAVYPSLNYRWLLMGEGEITSECMTESNKRIGIPLIPLSAMAGSFPGEQQVLECECERYVVPAFSGADFLIHVKGDSMEPHYKAGDIVACKIVPMDGLFFQWNHVYVIDTDQGPLIKRVKPSTEEGMITIISDNDRYEPFTIPLNRIYHIALVLGLIRLE